MNEWTKKKIRKLLKSALVVRVFGEAQLLFNVDWKCLNVLVQKISPYWFSQRRTMKFSKPEISS